MTNTNCLENIRCPKCKQESHFKIEALIVVGVTDEGTGDTQGDYQWAHNSFTHCPECDFDGVLSDFYLDDQLKEETALVMAYFSLSSEQWDALSKEQQFVKAQEYKDRERGEL